MNVYVEEDQARVELKTQHLHRSVLLDEALNWWCFDQQSVDICENAVYQNTEERSVSEVFVDCTFGRGGHSRSLLARKEDAELLVFDKDPAAIQVAEVLREEQGSRVHVAHHSFADIQKVVTELGFYQKISGILMDLGVSSPQLDEPERGFSFMRNGPLDMRMDTSQGETAAEWLHRVDEKTLADVIYRLGEEKLSRRIAKKIVEVRAETPIKTTGELAAIVSQVIVKRVAGKHPATRTFQAIRMHINSELDDLRIGLEGAFESLKVGGRLVVLSFHSLEDRIVKQFMQRYSKPAELPRGLPILAEKRVIPGKLCVKGQKPNADEISSNPRARSAILRVIEKVI